VKHEPASALQPASAAQQPAFDRQPPASGPAAARALLAESASSSNARGAAESPASTSSTSGPSSAPSPQSEAAAVAEVSAAAPGTALDLLCLTGAHGLLLVPQPGLSREARRLLKDILSSASRVIENRLAALTLADKPAKSNQARLQSLRFSWPPVVPGGDQIDAAVVPQSSSDTVRALRGFLQRQLQNKAEPVVLYVAVNGESSGAGDLSQLLVQADLPVATGRLVALEAPELLMSDSALKRTLWQTLSAL